MACCDQPGLMPLAEGIEKLLDLVQPTQQIETVPLAQAADRVLAKAVVANANVPGFDNSAMDGYAVAFDSIETGKEIFIQGKSFAGQPFDGALPAGSAIRIMTGAVVPAGADTVVMQENCTPTDHGVIINSLNTKGSNIRRAGEDIKTGQQVLTADTKLKPAHLALLASIGCAAVCVYKQTTVGLLSTGDELKEPGSALALGEIYNSNGPAVQSMLEKLNVRVINYGIIADDPALFRQAFLKADSECDFVITSGGVSVGEADYTKDVLEELGRINFWKLAIKPGKPFAFGQLPNSYFIGLPGNPVSAMVTFHILASQAIRQHQHIGYQPMQRLRATSLNAINKTPGRMDFQRGTWSLNGDTAQVELTRQAQGSHILSSLADANCYIALEQDRGAVTAGEAVELWLFDELM